MSMLDDIPTWHVPAYMGQPKPVYPDSITVAARWAVLIEREGVDGDRWWSTPEHRMRDILHQLAEHGLIVLPDQIDAATEPVRDAARQQVHKHSEHLVRTLRVRAEMMRADDASRRGVELAARWIETGGTT